MTPLKATLLDDDAFRLLAIPFGGPILSKASPRGVDVDGEWFSERTDIRPDWLTSRAVDWQHGKDDLGVMSPARYAAMAQAPERGREVIGKATDLAMAEDGWWVTVWLDRGARHLRLVQQLAERAASLFGSSETIMGMQSKSRETGEILVWPYWRQTLTTTPANTHSVMRPLKAAIADALTDYPDTTPAFWRDITGDLRDLAADLRLTSPGGDDAAKAGRVLSAVNERDILDAIAEFEAASGRALTGLRTVLERARQTTPGEGQGQDPSD